MTFKHSDIREKWTSQKNQSSQHKRKHMSIQITMLDDNGIMLVR